MDCEKIRQWLITDYLDSELDQKRSVETEHHLKVCSACREFVEAVRKAAVTPFKNTERLCPDPAVWQRIQGQILAEKERSAGRFGNLADLLAPLQRVSLPVFRVAFATALIVTVVVVARWPSGYTDPAYAYIGEQMA